VAAVYGGYVDRYLEERPEKTRPKGVLYVTDLTKPCLRNALFSIIDPQPYPVNTLRVFEAGNVLEDWWVRNVLTGSKNVSVLGTQLPCYYSDGVVEIHGRLDALCQHGNGRLVGHEVKSIKSAVYVQRDGPKEEHVRQIQFYINVLGLDEGWVDYLDKNVMLNGQTEDDSVDQCFPVKRDYGVFTDLVSRARGLARYVKAGAAPAEKGWLCDYCLYREACKE